MFNQNSINTVNNIMNMSEDEIFNIYQEYLEKHVHPVISSEKQKEDIKYITSFEIGGMKFYKQKNWNNKGELDSITDTIEVEFRFTRSNNPLIKSFIVKFDSQTGKLINQF